MRSILKSRSVMIATSLLAGFSLVHCVADEPTTAGDDSSASDAGPDGSLGDAGPGSDGSVTDSGVDAGPIDFPVEVAAEHDDDSERSFACARYASGKVYCWGDGVAGQLGVDPSSLTQNRSTKPIQVSGIVDAKKIVVGEAAACALRQTGDVMCWGSNDNGQLGNPAASVIQPSPIAVVGLPSGAAVDVTMGGGTACAIASTGDIWCWGQDGQDSLLLTDGGTNQPPTHIAVADPPKFAKLAMNNDSACAITTGQVTYCWGKNVAGEVGVNSNGFNTSVPPMPTLGGKGGGDESIASGTESYCVVSSASPAGAWCWGTNFVLGTPGVASVPASVDSFGTANGVLSVAAGASEMCGVFVDGGVQCVGAGFTDAGRSSDPILEPGLSDATQVAVGNDFACAVRKGGGAGNTPSIVCWGSNGFGQLGNGTTTDAPTPVQVSNP